MVWASVTSDEPADARFESSSDRIARNRALGTPEMGAISGFWTVPVWSVAEGTGRYWISVVSIMWSAFVMAFFLVRSQLPFKVELRVRVAGRERVIG